MKTGAEQFTGEKLMLILPAEIIEDLNKIAAFHNTDRDKIIYSYIVDGIASDSREAKRKEFTDRAHETCRKKNKSSKSVEEICKNLLY